MVENGVENERSDGKGEVKRSGMRYGGNMVENGVENGRSDGKGEVKRSGMR
jgi:hypothetical protein